MSALDGPPADGAVAPAKKSLRSKRLMRPGKTKAAHNPDGESPQDEDAATEIPYDKDRPASAHSSSRGSETNRHSGTDTETLAADSAHGLGPSPRLPPVDNSVSGMSFSSADADVFIEASDTQTSSRPASHNWDSGGLAGTADEPAAVVDESAEDLMQMLAGLQVPDEPHQPASAGADTTDLLGFSPGGLASSYDPTSAQADEAAPHSRRGSHSTVASPAARPATGDSARRDSSGDHTSRPARRSSSINSGPRRRLSVAEPEPDLGYIPISAGSAGEQAHGHTLGRSASMRQGARSPDQRTSPTSPTGSAGAKKNNRRSILLTSFVPPVGLGGGPTSSAASRSSAESRAESVVETPADSSMMNGVVEISPGGKVSKRASLLDGQRAPRPQSEVSMTPIRLRPSAEAVSAAHQQTDTRSAAMNALHSISERIGGAVSIKEEDEDDDDDLPEWMKEVQRRKRAAQEKEEEERAAAVAAAAAREAAFEAATVSPPAAQSEAHDHDLPAAAQTVEAAAEPVVSPGPAKSAADTATDDAHLTTATPAAAADAGQADSKTDDDDDVPLTEIDLGGRNAEPVYHVRPTPPVPQPPASAGAATRDVAIAKDKPLPPLVSAGRQDARPAGPEPAVVPARSIYRSLSASLGISQAAQQAEPARQSGSQLPTVDERQRSSSQASASPSASAAGIFAAVSSFFGRASTQQAAPPALHSNASSTSNLTQNTMEFPGMRPSTASTRPVGGSDNPAVDSLLSQLEAQNQQILKDSKARVFAHEAPSAQAQQDGAGADAVDWEFWGVLMNDYDKVSRAEPRKLARSVYVGIPGAVRGTVWQLMAKSR
ncbi:GTPase-activating protein, partial [Coemansia spiralis]